MCRIYDPRRGGRRSGVLDDKPLRARLWAVLAIFAVFAADRAVKRLLLSGAVQLSGTALIPGVATSSHISFSAFRLAWPSLPTVRVVVHRNAQWPHDLGDRPRYLNVGARRAPYFTQCCAFPSTCESS